MKKCTQQDIPEVLDILRKDIPNCFYLYVDISKYGLKNPNLSIWIGRINNNINSIVMKYFNSMQVYTLANTDIQEIAELIQNEGVPIITGTDSTCEALALCLHENYELSYGWIFEIDKFRYLPSPEYIDYAKESELQECASLICMDKVIGGHYSPESLTKQLIERRREGMGRNYVIRKEGRIIAHIATYAEYENLAVSSGLIVHPDWRTAPYGAWLESYLFNTLLKENKRIFSFLRSEKRVKYYKAFGVSKGWRTGKLARKGA